MIILELWGEGYFVIQGGHFDAQYLTVQAVQRLTVGMERDLIAPPPSTRIGKIYDIVKVVGQKKLPAPQPWFKFLSSSSPSLPC